MLLLFLFVYVYLLTIFKGDRHLAVVDVDSIDELADIGFVVGFKLAGISIFRIHADIMCLYHN